LAQERVVGLPRPLALDVPLDAQLGPRPQLLVEDRAHGARLQAQRVAREVGGLGEAAPGGWGDEEVAASGGRRVGGVEVAGACLGEVDGDGHARTPAPRNAAAFSARSLARSSSVRYGDVRINVPASASPSGYG